jgi:oligopeptide transport system ATP-binding protein
MKKNDKVLIRVERLVKHFPITRGLIIQREVASVKAVDGVSFSIRKGETFGLVGESGCGKSTIGREIIQLLRPTSGSVYFKDVDLTKLNGKEMLPYRKHLQIIFQDPYSSLNPRMTVGKIIAEPIEFHKVLGDSKESRARVKSLLEQVGLNPVYINRYPNEFSGGQRQRIGIARAIALDPEFVVCDEPISALDVSIQVQVINLLEGLQERLGLTYLFIAHDLSIVRHIADRVAVMYLGKLMEFAPADELYEHALHPYTRALLSAVPIPDPALERQRKRTILKGDVPNPINPPKGCPFHTRCPIAEKICVDVKPEWREIDADHWVFCHLV